MIDKFRTSKTEGKSSSIEMTTPNVITGYPQTNKKVSNTK